MKLLKIGCNTDDQLVFYLTKKKGFWDYHTHNVLCGHASGVLEDYVQSAIQKGLVEIGLSDHFPMDLMPKSAGVWDYAMDKSEFPQYLAEAKRLREKYQDQIIVRIASEVDYFPGCFTEYKAEVIPYLEDFDYVLGSVHVIQWDGIDAWAIDEENNPDQLAKFGVEKCYAEYYRTQIKMVQTGF